MAVSVTSILKAFMSLLIYYGFYYVMRPWINTFTSTHGNAFDIFLVVLIPFIIFIIIGLSMFTDPDSNTQRYR